MRSILLPRLPIRGTGRPDKYLLRDGTRVPSVTTITGHRKANVEGLLVWANKLGLEGKSHKDERDAAAGAGSLAHMMVENTIHGQDPLAGIVVQDEVMLQQAQQGWHAYMSWQEMLGLEYVETEMPMVSEGHRFGGTPDAVGQSKDGKLLLLDWKTSNAVYGDYLIQLAAYRILWNSNRDRKLDGVCLLRFGKEHGDFHFHSYPLDLVDLAWQGFLHLLELYRIDARLKKAAT